MPAHALSWSPCRGLPRRPRCRSRALMIGRKRKAPYGMSTTRVFGQRGRRTSSSLTEGGFRRSRAGRGASQPSVSCRWRPRLGTGCHQDVAALHRRKQLAVRYGTWSAPSMARGDQAVANMARGLVCFHGVLDPTSARAPAQVLWRIIPARHRSAAQPTHRRGHPERIKHHVDDVPARLDIHCHTCFEICKLLSRVLSNWVF